MKKIILSLTTLLLLNHWSIGQDIAQIFKALPLSYTPELTHAAKDLLIKNKNYTIPGGDSIETMKCNYSVNEEDHLQLEYYYSTGQSGFIVIELKKFKQKHGNPIIVYSKYGGAYRAFDQHSLKTFEYVDGKLIITKETLLPETITTKEYMKPNIPDSLKTNEINISSSYSLNPKKSNTIEYLINPQSKLFDDWIATTSYSYVWNGKTFEKK